MALPLALLPAFPFDARMWDRVRIGLSDHTRLITPEFPGFNGIPLPAGEPDLALLAEDVVAMLDRLELDRVILGGCSMGGYVTMAVLRAAPRRVAGLVLIDTKSTADTVEAKENRAAMAARALAEGAGGLVEDMLPKLVGPTTLARRPDVVDSVRRLFSDAPAEVVAWQQRAMAARPDSAAALRGADLPALIVHGEEDQLIPLELARSMADLLPRSELVVLEECGHMPSLEQPAELTTAVSGWLDRI
jgi:pimeloyl-ACP methyl ester carboxylesterase